jgi:hypothetical protein
MKSNSRSGPAIFALSRGGNDVLVGVPNVGNVKYDDPSLIELITGA